MIEQAMVLAAGKGTRLGELTQATPKPLLTVAGEEPVLLRTLRLLRAAGVRRLVVNAFHLGDQVEAAVVAWAAAVGLPCQVVNGSPSAADKMDVCDAVYVVNEPCLLGVGGGLKNALPLFDDAPFLCVNADVVWRESGEGAVPLVGAFAAASEALLVAGARAVLAVTDVSLVLGKQGEVRPNVALTADGSVRLPANGEETRNAAGQPVVACVAAGSSVGARAVCERGEVFGFVEAPVTCTHMGMGVWAGVPALLEGLSAGEAAEIRSAWLAAQREGRLKGWVYGGAWVDMGTVEGLAVARGF